MYVCICKGITDSHIKDAVINGASTLRAVRQELGAMTQCGKCGLHTKQVIDQTLAEMDNLAESELFYAAG